MREIIARCIAASPEGPSLLSVWATLNLAALIASVVYKVHDWGSVAIAVSFFTLLSSIAMQIHSARGSRFRPKHEHEIWIKLRGSDTGNFSANPSDLDSIKQTLDFLKKAV
jgi:hypothetical protein